MESAERLFVQVLPRVRDALTRFVSPVATTRDTSHSSVQEKLDLSSEFRRSNKKDFKLIQGGRSKDPPKDVNPVPETTSTLPQVPKKSLISAATYSATSTFLQLFKALKDQKANFLIWIGKGTYSREGRKGRKFQLKKGTMINHWRD